MTASQSKTIYCARCREDHEVKLLNLGGVDVAVIPCPAMSPREAWMCPPPDPFEAHIEEDGKFYAEADRLLGRRVLLKGVTP